MMNNLKSIGRLSAIFALAVVSSGCTTTSQILDIVSDKPDYSSLYLRGSFTWWEADPEFKVQSHGAHQYSVSVDLVADGQPYEFKFADENWSPGLSCGYKDKSEDEVIALGVGVAANCDTPVDNFKFTPPASGKYLFVIDFSGWGEPEVKVVQI